jgi:sugar/nucleoside kinase (ribokinase family)
LGRRTRQPVFITLGEEGALVCTTDECQRIAAAPVRGPLDMVGAGDAFFAALAASLAVGSTAREAGAIANLAAAVTVEKLGQTGTATPEEIVERFEMAEDD